MTDDVDRFLDQLRAQLCERSPLADALPPGTVIVIGGGPLKGGPRETWADTLLRRARDGNVVIVKNLEEPR